MRNKLLSKTIFLAAAALVLIVIATLGTGFWQYSSARADATERNLEAARSISLYVRDQQLRHLKLASTAFAANAEFVAGLARAMPADEGGEAIRDVAAIRELLDQRRHEAGLDAAAILDASGKFVAAAGDGFLPGHDLSSLAITVKSARELVQSSAVLDDDVQVPLIAVTPLTDGGRLTALLVTGARMEAGTLRTIAAMAGTDLALIAIEPTGPSVVDSTLEEHAVEQLAASLDKDRGRWTSPLPPADLAIEIDGQRTPGRYWPVQAAAKKAFFLALPLPTQREAIERILVPPLIVAACGALLVVSILFLIAWRLALAPLAAAASLSERARRGDFALELKPEGSHVVRRVADLINYLLRELDRHRVPHGAPRRRATDIR